MSHFEQQLDLPADPVSLARRLAPQPGFAVLWAADDSGPSYLACDPCAVSHGLDPEPGLGIGVNERGPMSFPRWIGVLPYESLRAVERTTQADSRPAPDISHPIWFRYGAVLRVDRGVTVLGDDPQAARQLIRLLESPARPVAAVRLRRIDRSSAELHKQRIEQARQLILDGELYLVNLARRFEFEVQGAALDLLQRAGELSRPRFGAYIELGDTQMISTSPELFLKLTPDRNVITAPIKGTRPRRRDAEQDAKAAQSLAHDPKERAELSMVIDVERNDLGQVAEVGSVRVCSEPTVQPCGAVWHRIAEVGAKLDARHGRGALLSAMAPSGSVTGAPKIRAMEVIAQLEAERRGLYTGALGFVSHDGGLCLAMAIRTLTVRQGLGCYHAGGGIVVDSDPALEVQETEWKAQQLLSLCG